jgi:hypothetical protein
LLQAPRFSGSARILSRDPAPSSPNAMALVNAPYLGLERFNNERNKEHWSNASDNDNSTILRAVYQQVLGHQYVMKSERLEGAESLFKNG